MNNKKTLVMSTLALALSANMAMAATAPKTSTESFIDGLDKNVSVTTNYVWRGLSQAQNAGAVQGGATYNHDSGLSVDLWLSSTGAGFTPAGPTPSNEFDVTVSYAMQKDKMGIEFGLISYNYPQSNNSSAAAKHEIFGGININNVNAYVYLNPTKRNGNNLYIDLSVEIDEFELALGINSNDVSTASYNQVTGIVHLTKDLSLSLSQTDIDGAKEAMALTYSIPLK